MPPKSLLILRSARRARLEGRTALMPPFSASPRLRVPVSLESAPAPRANCTLTSPPALPDKNGAIDARGDSPMPQHTAVLALADGALFWGRGVGATGRAVGEVCFNTAQTGYQEIMTDPSYAGQIITFTFPHIGNGGSNPEDIETMTPAARGCVVSADITEPANWRAAQPFDAWLKSHSLVGMCGVDTRRLTRRIRDGGAPSGVLAHAPDGRFDTAALIAEAAAWPGLEGMDLAKDVTCRQTYSWQ